MMNKIELYCNEVYYISKVLLLLNLPKRDSLTETSVRLKSTHLGASISYIESTKNSDSSMSTEQKQKLRHNKLQWCIKHFDKTNPSGWLFFYFGQIFCAGDFGQSTKI